VLEECEEELKQIEEAIDGNQRNHLRLNQSLEEEQKQI